MSPIVRRFRLLLAVSSLGLASAVHAQDLGGIVGGVTSTAGQAVGGASQAASGAGDTVGNMMSGGLGQALGDVSQMPRQYVAPSLERLGYAGSALDIAPGLYADVRKMRLRELIRSNSSALEDDGNGQPVRRGEVIATDPDAASLAIALRAGYRISADEREPSLGLRMLTLAVPARTSARKAVKQLRQIAPGLNVDYNHVFEPAGGALSPAANIALAGAGAMAAFRPGTRIAMIDGGVASHPSLRGAAIEQRGFAGPAQPTGHGTAVGSLLVGDLGTFHGAARGAQLFVGDVYGGNPAAGSASVIVKALAWAASKNPRVINISLVGPANQTLARAMNALRSRGIAVVAAVGNDGPAAPPQYPASYDGVIAVTGVDGGDRALREAGRASHIDFAAPGADLVAAAPGRDFVPVRGTSFAAPLVSARLAATGSAGNLAREAIPGRGKVGRGIVCKSCAVAPRSLQTRKK